MAKKNSDMDIELFTCACNSLEHQIIFRLFDDGENEKCVYGSIHLMPHNNLFKRILCAIKYVFGYRCKYGEFEEFVFKSEDAYKINVLFNYLIKYKHNEYND